MDARRRERFLCERLLVYTALLGVCCAVQLAAGSQVSTAECAWIPGGGQGRASCAKAAGPAGPKVVRWRPLGTGGQYGTSFAGIGPQDVLFKGLPYADYRTCLLAQDWHTLLSTDDAEGGTETLDDGHLYLAQWKSYTEDFFWCYDLHGRELWAGSYINGTMVPVHGRGLAIIGRSDCEGQLEFLEADGNVISRSSLEIAGADLCRVYDPAFDSSGRAVWVAATYEDYPWGGTTYHWHIASEANWDFWEFDTTFYSSSSPEKPYGSSVFVIVNGLDNVLVCASKKLTQFNGIEHDEVIWQNELEGNPIWDDVCGDPMGGWWVIHATRENGRDTVMLQRINPNGVLESNTIIDNQERAQDYYPICDIEGNVYFRIGGKMVSCSSEGELRWQLKLSNTDICIHGMDSRGVIYASEFNASPPRLFAVGDGPPQHSRVWVKLPERAAGDAYSPGDELVVLLQPYNFGEDEVVDGYLAVILPNEAISFYTPSGFSASPTPWFPNVYLPNSFEMIDAPASLGVIPEGAPEGTCIVIAGFTQPGTLTPVDELFPLTFQVVGR